MSRPDNKIIRLMKSAGPALAFFAAMAAPAWAGKKVMIVRSSSLPLYEQVVTGFKRCTQSDIVGDDTLGDDGSADAALADARAKAPDLILSLGSNATRAVREKMSSTPSAFAMVIDPTSNKLSPPGVPLDLRPGAQVEFLQKNFPRLKRIGVLYSPGRNVEVVSELRSLQAKGTPIVLLEVSSIDKLDAAIRDLSSKADCLLMLSDPVIYSPQTAPQIILQTLQNGLPIIAISPAYVKAGALLGLSPDPQESGCAAADVVQKVLGGEKGASSFVWPTKYVVSVNLVVAGRLNIQVPSSVISSAEQVIK